MDADIGLFEALFFVSLTVNLCAWLHFGLFALLDRIVAPETQNRITRLRLAHKLNAAFMRSFYADAVLFTCLPIATVVLTFTSGVLDSPFKAYYPKELRILFSVMSGVFIFLLFRVCLVAKNNALKYMNIIIYIVSLTTAATVLVSGEDATIGLILAVSTGDILLLNIGKFVELLRVQNIRCRRIVVFLAVYACVVFRAFLPLACISISLVKGKPLDMSYPSLFFFFVGILFFGAINTLQITSVALLRFCRRKRETVIEVPYRQFGSDSEPKPEDIAIAISSIEMPPSYTEACGDSSYLPVTPGFPTSGSSTDMGSRDLGDERASSIAESGSELLTLDVGSLAEIAESQSNDSVEHFVESTADTAALV